MDISIIIINYNLSNETKNCIDSLLKVADDFDFEIILVDNHSEDESILKIAENYKQSEKINLSFIRTEKNIGFGNACNLAAEKAYGEWLFLLNPDTLTKQNIFQQVLNEFQDESIKEGIIGLNVNSSNLLDYSAGLFPNFFLEFLNVFLIGRYFEAAFIKFKTLLSRTKKIKVQWVMGAALFIRKDLFARSKWF